MKMTALEKRFVNNSKLTSSVTQEAERLLGYTQAELGQRYLDVGAGNGAATITIARKYGLNVTGIDVDPDQVQLAKANSLGVPNAEFLVHDGVELPFVDETFDIVATFKVMHHIPNWRVALVEMERVLKPGGYFIYYDVAFPIWITTLGRMITPGIVNMPTADGLEEFVNEHALAVLHQSQSPGFGRYEAVWQKGSAA